MLARGRPGAVLTTLMVAAAVAMLGYRFLHLDLAPFARDEPQFLAAAREQLRTGHWVSANPLYGNLGLRYGPTAFWRNEAAMYRFPLEYLATSRRVGTRRSWSAP